MEYRISQWNYYNYDGPRTNNLVEGWHPQLMKIVKKNSHSNILQKEQATTDMKLDQFEDSAIQPSRKRR